MMHAKVTINQINQSVNQSINVMTNAGSAESLLSVSLLKTNFHKQTYYLDAVIVHADVNDAVAANKCWRGTVQKSNRLKRAKC